MAMNLAMLIFGTRAAGGNNKKAVHFIGIGGIGMSALARWFKAQKWSVSGSDAVKSGITRDLAKEGLKVKIGHKNRHILHKIDLVIYSQAIKNGNPELKTARRFGIRAISYPEAIGRLTECYTTIAVAGAHGKTTTTALASLVLISGGLDPTVIIGGKLKEFGNKNFRSGKSKYLVLEADEYGKAFLHYSPAIAVVTNIDREHLDTFRNLSDIKKHFLKFLSNTKNGGAFILNKDDKIITSLSGKINKIARKRNCRIFWYSIRGNIAGKIKWIIKIPGKHNISDAVAAYKVGCAFGISHKKILLAISSYRGSWRRMEYKGKFPISNFQFPIFNDYAHHPTEITATLKAFREKFSGSFVICVFQPHQARRLKYLFKDFQSAFKDADVLVLFPLYRVAGRDKISGRFNSKKLAEAIKKKYPEKVVFYAPNPKNIKRFLRNILNSEFRILNPGIIVMMGAGDIVNYTDLLIK